MQLKTKSRESLVLPPFKVADGHNNSVWARARLCRNHGLHYPEAVTLIDTWITANCHLFKRALPSHEVQQQIQNAYSYAGTPPGKDKQQRKTINPTPPRGGDVKLSEFIEQAFADFGVEELKREHPNIISRTLSPVGILRTLFCDVGRKSEESWVCLGRNHKGMRSHKLIELHRREANGEHFSEFQFVVPNPMTKETGTTLAGRGESWRCRDNAAREEDRLFYVVEYDATPDGAPVPKDVQARRLWCLNVCFQNRLVLVVDTGGKSLHGWFFTRGLTQQDRELFWKLALATGADPAGERPEQFFRLPNGTRAPKTPGEGSKRQEVLYLNTRGGRGTL